MVKRQFLISLLLGGILFSPLGIAVRIDTDLIYVKRLLDRHINQYIKSWLDKQIVYETLRYQNIKTKNISKQDIVVLDNKWREEAKVRDGRLINKTLSNELSEYLREVKRDNANIYSEIFITDSRGLNAGQTDITSDYFQGDEDKYLKTYSKSSDAIFIDKVEYDESTGRYQVQVSLTIADPSNKEKIGVATIGIDLDRLLLFKIPGV